MQRQLPQQATVIFLHQLLSPTGAENRLMVTAVTANVHTHVFHDAQYRHVNLFEHHDAIGSIE
ncbi:hypothetical protein D3C71_2111730 [compost metagenome]